MEQSVEQVVREHYGRLLSALVHRFGDIGFAEDTLQDAIEAALVRWSADGWPANPPAWLMTVAVRKGVDQIRRRNIGKQKIEQLASEPSADEAEPVPELIPDHRLQMIFTCCHPAIDTHTRTIMVLKNICGLSTDKIARAYMLGEPAMAQRLVRAKSKIAKTNIPFEVPAEIYLPERLGSVLQIIYLIFNEGYQSTTGSRLIDTDLCQEAIYLGKLLVNLLPQETEALGLLALMFFHDSRREARVADDGELIDLANQNRNLWNRQHIKLADRILKGALMKGRAGSYQIQAAISAVHCHTKNWKDTDWQQIALLYGRLEAYDSSPVVVINHAVALSFAHGPAPGLAYLDRVENDKQLQKYHPYYIARADMLQRLNDPAAAIAMYQQAILLTDNEAEKRYLATRVELLRPSNAVAN